MQIQTLLLGDFSANCYIVTDAQGITAVIDPGAPAPELFQAVADRNVRYILLTHGHFDHIMGVAELKKRTGAAVCIGEKDAPMLSDPVLSLARINSGYRQTPIIADRLLHDGDVLADFADGLQVMETPGHTPGGVCYLAGNILFTGDTLFCRTVGRTDFPGGSMADLIRSVDRLQALPGDYIIYPGHNRATTMEAERQHNRYIRKKNAYLNSQS